MIEVRLLSAGEAHVLNNLAPGLFDEGVNGPITAAFFADPRHHLIVALDGDLVVGAISAVEYLHPDKTAAELWINEVDVSPAYQRQGIARRMLDLTLQTARHRGCLAAWVLTETDNDAAKALYASADGAPALRTIVEYSFDLTTRPERRGS